MFILNAGRLFFTDPSPHYPRTVGDVSYSTAVDESVQRGNEFPQVCHIETRYILENGCFFTKMGTGTLVGDNMILTCAHVTPKNIETMTFPSPFKEIQIGIWFSAEKKGSSELMTESFEMHPSFTCNWDENFNPLNIQGIDLALIKISEAGSAALKSRSISPLKIELNQEKIEDSCSVFLPTYGNVFNRCGQQLSKNPIRHLLVSNLFKLPEGGFGTSFFSMNPENPMEMRDPIIFSETQKYPHRLSGLTSPGDSGAPLVGKFDGELKVLGVIKDIRGKKEEDHILSSSYAHDLQRPEVLTWLRKFPRIKC